MKISTRQICVTGASVVLGACLIAPALAQQTPVPGYRPHMWDGGWHGWFFGPMMMLAWIAVAVVVVILLARWLGIPRRGGSQSDRAEKSPIDILKERYARGEIDSEEFEERRRTLGD